MNIYNSNITNTISNIKHYNNPIIDNILNNYINKSQPYSKDIINIMIYVIDKHEKTKLFINDQKEYLKNIVPNTIFKNSISYHNLNSIEYFRNSIFNTYYIKFEPYIIIDGYSYTGIPTLTYQTLITYNIETLNNLYNKNYDMHKKIQLNIYWDLIYKHIGLIQTSFNLYLINFVKNIKNNNYNISDIYTQKKFNIKYFNFNNKDKKDKKNKKDKIDSNSDNNIDSQSDIENNNINDNNKNSIEDELDDLFNLDNLSKKNDKKPDKNKNEIDNISVRSKYNINENNEIKNNINNEISDKIINNSKKNKDISEQINNKNDQINNKSDQINENLDIYNNLDDINSDEFENDNNKNIENNNNIDYNIDKDKNNISLNKSYPEYNDWEYKDNEIRCIQDIDDKLNPNIELININKKQRYYPVKKEELIKFIKDNYMNGKKQVHRDYIKIIKWVNYKLTDYDNDDIELFKKIDEKNYFKINEEEELSLNEKFEYEFMIIKNYKIYFKELYPEDEENKNNKIYKKIVMKLSEVSETKDFDPDKHIYLYLKSEEFTTYNNIKNNKKKNTENEELLELSDEDSDEDSRMDIEDDEINNKSYKKNKNSDEKNDKSNKKNNKYNKNNRKSLDKKDKAEEKKDKSYKKNKKRDEKNDITDNKNKKNKDKNNKDNKKGYAYFTLGEIYKINGFNKSRRLNIYNAYRTYTSRIFDIILYKTGWRKIYESSGIVKKELPMICLGCLLFYAPDGFRKHILDYHNMNLEPLSTSMRQFVYSQYNKEGELVNRIKNENYNKVYKEWENNNINSKDNNSYKLNDSNYEKEYLSQNDINEYNIFNRNNIKSDKDNNYYSQYNKIYTQNNVNHFKNKNRIYYDKDYNIDKFCINKFKKVENKIKIGENYYDFNLLYDNIYIYFLDEILNLRYITKEVISTYDVICIREKLDFFIKQYIKFKEIVNISTITNAIDHLESIIENQNLNKEDKNLILSIIEKLESFKIDILGVQQDKNNIESNKNNIESEKKNIESNKNNIESDKKNI